jgi:prefoldin subunit 5
MSDERIEKTKAAVDAAGHIPAEKKAALSAALSKLKPALAQISQTHHEDAQDIAQLIEASTHEATRAKKEPELLRAALNRLKESVEKFESSHPELVQRVNGVATVLAEMGI